MLRNFTVIFLWIIIQYDLLVLHRMIDEENKKLQFNDQDQYLSFHRQVSSDKKEIYEQFFSDMKLNFTQHQHQQSKYNHQSREGQRSSNKEAFFSIQMIKRSTNFEAVALKVKYGNHANELTIFNYRDTSPSHNFKSMSSQANIFSISPISAKSIIKCFPVEAEDFKNSLIRVIKQYTILKIAAQLKVGPVSSNLHNFDIIVYEDCIEFAMQQCTKTDSLAHQYFGPAEMYALKEKLYLLHQMHIVHMDIKPDNICFSPYRQQLVFIDFGFSSILEEIVGQKTYTNFCGSLNYCSQEMLLCYTLQKSLHVDLYYNDVQCFQKTFKQLQSKKAIQQQNNCSSDEQEYCENIIEGLSFSTLEKIKNFYELIRTKWNLFSQKQLDFNSQQVRKFVLSNLFKLEQFTYTLPYSVCIEKLYNFIMLCKKTDDTYSRALSSLYISNYHILGYIQQRKGEGEEIKENNPPLKVFIDGVYLNKIESINIQMKQSNHEEFIDNFIFNRQLLKITDKKYYFKKMVEYLNLRQDISTFSQRVEAASILRQLYPFEPKKMGQISLLIACNMHLFDFLIQQQNITAGQQVSIIYSNLVILSAYDEMSQIEEKVINKCELSKTLMVLFLHFFISQAFQYFKGSMYTDRPSQNSFNLGNNITLKLTALSQKQKQRLLPYYQYFAKIFSNSNQHPLIQLLQLLEVMKSQKRVTVQFMKPLQLYVYSLLLSRYCQVWNVQGVIECIKMINQLEQPSLRARLEFYHFSMYKAFRFSNNFEGESAIIHRLQCCIGNEQLIQQFIIYGIFQFRCLQMGRKSLSEVIVTMNSILKRINLSMTANQHIAIELSNFLSLDISKLSQQVLGTFLESIEMCRSMFPTTKQQVLEKVSQDYQTAQSYLSRWGQFYKRLYNRVIPSNLLLVLYDTMLSLNQISKQKKINIEIEWVKTFVFIELTLYNQNYSQTARIIDTFINNKQRSVAPYHYIHIVLFGIKLSVLGNPTFQQKEHDLIQALYKWITTYQHWNQIFPSKQYFSEITKHINSHLILGHRFQQYWSFNRSLSLCLQSYITKQYIIMYRSSIIRSLFSRVDSFALRQYLFKTKFIKSEAINDYLIILLSYLLLQFKLTKNHYMILVNRINRINYSAKKGVQKMILYSLAHLQYFQDNKCSQRQRRFFKKRYLKSLLRSITKKQILQYFLRKVRLSTMKTYFFRKMQIYCLHCFQKEQNYYEEEWRLQLSSPFC